MLNIQYISVPFITAYNLYPYTDNASLSIAMSGTYVAIPFANDNFINYPTGFANFYSGSGFWFGSGFTSIQLNYWVANPTVMDTTGIYTGTFETGAMSGYVNNAIITGGRHYSGYFSGYVGQISTKRFI